MRIRSLLLGMALATAASPLGGQDVPPELSLERAIEIALGNSPAYLQVRNDEALSDWDVRQAYGQLLPSASASAGMSWQGAGEQRFGSLTLGDLGFGDQPSYYFSSYNVGLSYSLDYATLLAPSRAKAERNATQARIQVSESELVSGVTTAYLETLRQQEAVRLAEQQLESAGFNLRLAQGQLEVGIGTPIDVGQAEVQVGRSEVTVLQARNALETARMRLLQRMGVPIGQATALTTTFQLQEPTWELEELEAVALRQNPGLEASRRSSDAAEIGARSARSPYLPSMSIQTGWSGFTREASSVDFQIAQAERQALSTVQQCLAQNELYSRLTPPLPPLNCTQFVFTDARRQSIIDQNDQFPFAFERSPPQLSFGLSIPIFQGFSRQRNLEAARLQRDDLALQLRDQEISLRADLAIGLANVRTAYQSALLEQRNQELAEQQLRLARERYQLGAITFVELMDAQTVMAQAERDRSASVFAYHDAVTTLEALVGTALRNE